MNRYCLLALFLIVAEVSFCQTRPNVTSLHHPASFSYTAYQPGDEKNGIVIHASLYNPTKDTVYFLSWSCDGMEYSLEYDSLKFRLDPLLDCNASYPEVVKIPPYGKVGFKAHFKNRGKYEEIRLGFDLFEVNSSFRINRNDIRNAYFPYRRLTQVIRGIMQPIIKGTSIKTYTAPGGRIG